MPAAAVIPASIAYIKVAAVKKLVVGSVSRTAGSPPVGATGRMRDVVPVGVSAALVERGRLCLPSDALVGGPVSILRWCSSLSVDVGRQFYFEQIRVLRAGKFCLNGGAWNNGRGPRSEFVGLTDRR